MLDVIEVAELLSSLRGRLSAVAGESRSTGRPRHNVPGWRASGPRSAAPVAMGANSTALRGEAIPSSYFFCRHKNSPTSNGLPRRRDRSRGPRGGRLSAWELRRGPSVPCPSSGSLVEVGPDLYRRAVMFGASSDWALSMQMLPRFMWASTYRGRIFDRVLVTPEGLVQPAFGFDTYPRLFSARAISGFAFGRGPEGLAVFPGFRLLRGVLDENGNQERQAAVHNHGATASLP